MFPDVWMTKADYEKSSIVKSPEDELKEDESQDDELEFVGEPPIQDAEPESQSSNSDLMEKITAAIFSMDQNNPEHFSESTGNPLLDKVREITGIDTIKVKELNAAWKEVNGK